MNGSSPWKKIGTNSFWVFLATLSLAFSQWSIMAIIARIDGPYALGSYALAQAFANPAGYLAWLNIRQQFVISRFEGGSWADFLFLRLIFQGAVFLIVVLLIAEYYQKADIIYMAICVFVSKYVEGLFDLSYGRLQNEGRMRSLGYVSIIRALVTIPVYYLFYEYTHDVYMSLFFLSALNIAFYALQSARLKMTFFERSLVSLKGSEFAHRFHLVKYLFPFAISTVMMALVTSVPRLLLEHVVGAADLGQFAAVAHFVALGSVVVGSMTHAIAPVVASAMARGNEKTFWTVLYAPAVLLQLLCGLAAIIAAFFGSTIVVAIYGNAFGGDGSMVVWAAIAAGPVYASAIVGVGCYVLQLKRVYFSVYAGGLLVVAFVTMEFVGQLGASAAFLGMAICSILQVMAFSMVFFFVWRARPRSNLAVV